jgi:hypothetical protein
MSHKQTRAGRVLKIAFINLLVTVVLLLLFEGLASAIFVVKEAFFGGVPAGRRHVRYDPEIGWVNEPNVNIPNLYGPGLNFKTNSQSFRRDRDYSAPVPDGKIRVICSGNSFTMGYGVDNDNTWCQLLTSIDSRLETVNLGHGGYGVDQAYLWYKRNSPELDHDVHLFAFVTSNFQRMQRERFLGYGRPWLEVREGSLVVTNTPVPKLPYYSPRATHGFQVLARLNSLRLIRLLLSRQSSAADVDALSDDPRCRQVTLKIFEDLHAINEAKNSLVILVYLPVRADFMGTHSDRWREFLRRESDRNGWWFVDLVDELRTFPPHRVGTLFRGHYSEEGTAYIADVLYRRLLAIPQVAARLNGQ